MTLLVEREGGKDSCFEISNIEQIKGIPRGRGKGMLGFFDGGSVFYPQFDALLRREVRARFARVEV